MSDETPATELPMFKTLVPLERYDLKGGVPKLDARGQRIKIAIPAGSEVSIDGLDLVDLGHAVPANAAAIAQCEARGLTDAVIQRKVAERKRMDRGIATGEFAKLEAAQK